jgi:hypothetical protein
MARRGWEAAQALSLHDKTKASFARLRWQECQRGRQKCLRHGFRCEGSDRSALLARSTTSQGDTEVLVCSLEAAMDFVDVENLVSIDLIQ